MGTKSRDCLSYRTLLCPQICIYYLSDFRQNILQDKANLDIHMTKVKKGVGLQSDIKSQDLLSDVTEVS